MITRIQYKAARKLIRENGRAALRWMTHEVNACMQRLIDIQDSKDELQERADIVAYCRREGLSCTPRHTASRAEKNHFVPNELLTERARA